MFNKRQHFFLPLWTNWHTGPSPGILDWYTVLGGVIALVALGVHGSLYLALKTEGDLEPGARAAAYYLWPVLLAVTLAGLPATVIASPSSLNNYVDHPIAFVVPLVVIASLVSTLIAVRKGIGLLAFRASCTYLAAMLGGAAAGLFPVLLPNVGKDGRDLTIALAAAGPHTLRVDLVWWTVGMLLATM